MTPYIVAAGFYLIVTIPMTKLINSMEARMASGKRRRKKVRRATAPSRRSPAVVPDSTPPWRSLRMSETFAGSVDDDLVPAAAGSAIREVRI